MSHSSSAGLFPSCASAAYRAGQPAAARVRSQSDYTRSSLALHVTTDEGDTVDLSFDLTNLRQLQKTYARVSRDNAQQNQNLQGTYGNFSVNVTGDLNDRELAAIEALVQYLATGKPATADLSSLDSYAGLFSQTRISARNSVRLQA